MMVVPSFGGVFVRARQEYPFCSEGTSVVALLFPGARSCLSTGVVIRGNRPDYHQQEGS